MGHMQMLKLRKQLIFPQPIFHRQFLRFRNQLLSLTMTVSLVSQWLFLQDVRVRPTFTAAKMGTEAMASSKCCWVIWLVSNGGIYITYNGIPLNCDWLTKNAEHYRSDLSKFILIE